MTKYRLSFKTSVAKDLHQIPKRDVQSILKRIEGLADDPRPSGSEKLSGLERFRVRQGTYRIIYEIRGQDLIVMVVKIGHRRDVYRFL
jgi:mRNA interferase RelE/StbE